jgi:endogenous inhibitor of DNA gyrase (YacG/DUF329 family)
MYVLRCPMCGAVKHFDHSQSAPNRPFCSRRCQLIDLGKWFDEEFRISTPLEVADEGDGIRDDRHAGNSDAS